MKKIAGSKSVMFQANIENYKKIKQIAAKNDLTINKIFNDMIQKLIELDVYVDLNKNNEKK